MPHETRQFQFLGTAISLKGMNMEQHQLVVEQATTAQIVSHTDAPSGSSGIVLALVSAETAPHANLFAAMTGTRPEDWLEHRVYSWEKGDIADAPIIRSYGSDVFAIAAMTHRDGRVATACYDQQDWVFADCGNEHWTGPYEDNVYALACWSNDVARARAAYLQEKAVAAAPLVWGSEESVLATATQ